MSATTMTMWEGFFSAIVLQTLDPLVGQIAITPALGQPSGDAGQILDQSQPQHDRHGPEFA